MSGVNRPISDIGAQKYRDSNSNKSGCLHSILQDKDKQRVMFHLSKESDEHIRPVELPQTNVDDLGAGRGLGRYPPSHVHRHKLFAVPVTQMVDLGEICPCQFLPFVLHAPEWWGEEYPQCSGVFKFHRVCHIALKLLIFCWHTRTC